MDPIQALTQAAARGDITMDEFRRAFDEVMGSGGVSMPSVSSGGGYPGGAPGSISSGGDPRNLGGSRSAPTPPSGGGSTSGYPNPLTTPGHQQTGRAREPQGYPDPLTTPGHQQTGRARDPRQGQTGIARPTASGYPNPLLTPGHQQTGRARPPSDGGYREIPSDLPQRSPGITPYPAPGSRMSGGYDPRDMGGYVKPSISPTQRSGPIRTSSGEDWKRAARTV